MKKEGAGAERNGKLEGGEMLRPFDSLILDMFGSKKMVITSAGDFSTSG